MNVCTTLSGIIGILKRWTGIVQVIDKCLCYHVLQLTNFFACFTDNFFFL